MSTTPGITVRVTIPPEILDKYEGQVRSRTGMTVEDILAERLIQHVSAQNEKPIVLDDDSRRRIEQLVKRNLTTPQELVREVERALTVSIADLQIPLPPRLLDRLKSRSIRVGFPEFLSQLIVRCLEEQAGMR